MKDDKNIVQDSIKCLANAKFNNTTYEIARDIVLDYITDLEKLCDKYEKEHSTEFKIWKNERQQLKRKIEIMKKYFELICDIGYDYDGCNSVKSLKTLVDELIHLSSLGRAHNDKECIYESGLNEKLNILLEEIKDEK